MFNAIKSIDKGFIVKNCGISCLALIFNFSNLKMTILQWTYTKQIGSRF